MRMKKKKPGLTAETTISVDTGSRELSSRANTSPLAILKSCTYFSLPGKCSSLGHRASLECLDIGRHLKVYSRGNGARLKQ